MSVDIAWDLITSGSDGEALAESIRDFIHMKFQQITLPRFINAVHVHSFEFGSVSPEIQIKDICDPLPDFYEDEESDEDQQLNNHAHVQYANPNDGNSDGPQLQSLDSAELRSRVAAMALEEATSGRSHLHAQSSIMPHAYGVLRTPAESLAGPFARSGTPGIPGGTSNMSYFHFPVGGLSGAQTPLAAVAGGGPFATAAWLRDQQTHHTMTPAQFSAPLESDSQYGGGLVQPCTAGSISSPELGSPLYPSSPERRPVGYTSAEKVSDTVSVTDILGGPTAPPEERTSPSDLQVVAHVTYDGDVRMMLTAEIMLDYPMPSFVKIPLKLSITGVSFDGVAILAYIKKKMHFCFLDPEDADTLVGTSFVSGDTDGDATPKRVSKLGSLLKEIHVETEIGRQESGKQVLKNVGKVERFVLEQVRRIFEEEFVFPSFWTFLV